MKAAYIIQADANEGCMGAPKRFALDVFCDCKSIDECQVLSGYAYSHNERVLAFTHLGGEKMYIVQRSRGKSPKVKIIYVEDNDRETAVTAK